MAEYYFCKLEQMQEDTPFLNGVKTFANTQKKQVYVISAPLTDKKYRYNFHGAYILLVPKKKITFIYREGSKQEFENYVEDVLEVTNSTVVGNTAPAHVATESESIIPS